eukprot:2702199-Prorocentrum_lima.AAC.1
MSDISIMGSTFIWHVCVVFMSSTTMSNATWTCPMSGVNMLEVATCCMSGVSGVISAALAAAE